LYRVAASLLTGLHFCTYIFSVIIRRNVI